MAYEDTSVKKGIFSLALGTFSLISAGFCAYQLINGINPAEAVAIIGDVKQSATTLFGYYAFGAANFLLGTTKVAEGIYNLKEEMVL